MPDPPFHRKTRRRYENRSHARFLTNSCFHRLPLFNDDETRQIFVHALDWTRNRHHFHLWAWVLMPEHFHILIFPREATVSTILRDLKQRIANTTLARWRREGRPILAKLTDGNDKLHFWQSGGGHDHNLWNPKRIWNVIDYTHRNPVDRNLCARPDDWPWSSIHEYRRAGAGPFAIDGEHTPPRP